MSRPFFNFTTYHQAYNELRPNGPCSIYVGGIKTAVALRHDGFPTFATVMCGYLRPAQGVPQ